MAIFNKTQWFKAVESGDIFTLKSYISHGFNTDTLDREGFTALMNAVFFGLKDVVCFLLKNNVAIDTLSRNGQSALDIAIEENDLELVKIIEIHRETLSLCSVDLTFAFE